MSKGRSKNKNKRSIASIPKGLPQKSHKSSSILNPFEYQSTNSKRRVKHDVLNRKLPGQINHPTASGSAAARGMAQPRTSALARSLERRKNMLATKLQRQKKVNSFIDKRIGEKRAKSLEVMTQEEITLARIVKERVRRSKKSRMYDLDNDENDDISGGLLTHKGKTIDESYTGKGADLEDFLPSDEEDDYYADKGTLDRVDTEMHFGGGSLRQQQEMANNNPYGRPQQPGETSLGDVYRSRKEEMDEMIKRKKILKLEKQKSKEEQVEKFEALDDSFKELASLLQFRNKDQEYKENRERKEKGLLTQDEIEMDAWDCEMKTYQFERKVAATDRTKTPEEIAKKEVDRLQELEKKRLARMNGDFDNDDLSDISDDENDINKNKKKRKLSKTKGQNLKHKQKRVKGDDELDSENEEEEGDGTSMRFTSEGLVYLDKKGNIIPEPKHTVDDEDSSSSSQTEESDLDSDNGSSDSDQDGNDLEEDQNAPLILKKGMKVQGNYRASEQFGGHSTWYPGVISKVYDDEMGNTLYDVTYDDGDFEDGMIRKNLKVMGKPKAQKEEEQKKKLEMKAIAEKKRKAKQLARKSIPFVFEVPSTLDALHDMIATHATSGADASLIIQRIHLSNSVRLNKNNKEKMQNFYDVVMRRFVAVGDKIHSSGDGGSELGRYAQLDSLTKTLYAMAQDSPEIAGAVWGRRLGFFRNALGKRLRDSELLSAVEKSDFTAWPSLGTVLLLRALGHIFPVTDLRHAVVTPALLLIGQTIAQAPVRSLHDLMMGILCSSLMIEYTKDAKRIAPEALVFLAGVVRLFAEDALSASRLNPVPSLEAAVSTGVMKGLRKHIQNFKASTKNKTATVFPQLSLETEFIENDETIAATSIFCAALRLIQSCALSYRSALNLAEADALSQITLSLISLKPESKTAPLPASLSSFVAEVADEVGQTCKYNQPRMPLLRRSEGKSSEHAIKSFAPKMEDPTRYYMSKDKGKSQMQAELDRNRREYKREHKAAKRELRLDATFVENERRKEYDQSTRSAKEKRHKNFAWLEQEQATMNQQVRLGGGLLKGGGTGAARTKAASAQLGIKKGGKFR